MLESGSIVPASYGATIAHSVQKDIGDCTNIFFGTIGYSTQTETEKFMANEIFDIDRDNGNLTGTQFFSSKGAALQLTKIKTLSGNANFNGFIHVTPEEAMLLADQLKMWARPILNTRKKSVHWVET